MPRQQAKKVKKKVATKSKPKPKTQANLEDLVMSLANTVNTLTNEVKELKDSHERDSDESHALRKETKKKNEVKSKVKRAVKSATKPQVDARFELWSYDEYNQGSIVHSGKDLTNVVNFARRYLNEMNMDNALAADEKDKAWEAYFPVVFVDDEPVDDVLYAGNKKDGKHYVYVLGDNKWELRRPDPSVEFRFLLGEKSVGRNRTDWYLSDHRGREVTSLNDSTLENKTTLFVKVV